MGYFRLYICLANFSGLVLNSNFFILHNFLPTSNFLLDVKKCIFTGSFIFQKSIVASDTLIWDQFRQANNNCIFASLTWLAF